MRSLDAGGANASISRKMDPQKMPALALIRQRLRQNASVLRKTNLCRPLPPQQSRANKQEEGNERRHRVAGQAKKHLRTPWIFSNWQQAKNEWPAGTDRDFPEIQRAAKLLERLFDKIHFTDGHASRANDCDTLAESIFKRADGCFER